MRRKKPRVVWLPTTNTNSVDTNASSTWSVVSAGITGAANASGAPATVIEVPVVMDGTASDPLSATSSLADIESSGYRLRRIVGKIYCFIAQTALASEDLWGVSAGFIIRRSDPATGGSQASSTGQDQLDPANIDNSMDPWIWRRSWLLSNYFTGSGSITVNQNRLEDLIHSNGGNNYGRAYPGGNAEGPHVDQKTARIVGPEERLFLNISATPIITSSTDTSLVVIYDLRCLASMRQNIGNRRNASR